MLALAVGITLTTGGVAAAQQSQRQTVFYAEVPAADRATAIVSVTGTTVGFAEPERWSPLTTPTASHIHAGAAATAGPVKIPSTPAWCRRASPP
jgi:hypothetical protein